MKTTHLHTMRLALTVLMLIAASLACRVVDRSEAQPTPIPPTATQSSDPSPTVTPLPPTTEKGGGGPNLVITDVTLDTTTPLAGGWVVVAVTIENQGGATATGFELVLIPHYGWGPPNPAGYEVLPDLAPGATHTVTFTPGVLYTDAGTFTLRVLVTDNWYDIGNPDSTGSAGDYQDFTITVTEPAASEPNLVITDVTLDTTTPLAGGWVVVDVTVENQGGATATGFELVLIPHYGWGPPNPAGYEVLPDLAPGATHTVTFTPGVLYTDAGTFTLRVLVTDDWYDTGNPDSTGSAGDYQDFTITVTEPAASEPNLVIADVTLDTTTPPAGGWVVVAVTIENQGGATATGFELVLIPHYGWGPPNPAGYEVLPDLAPGATHTITFTPGVLYTDAGTFTLRVLVTDDWYDIGNPDSTGTAGDYQDFTITVTEPAASEPNLVIADVTLDTTTPPAGGWVVVAVTIENQGGATATGFELVLIPHYGWGPPNPAGYEVLPDLAPGATHTITFTPGVLYTDAGTFTLRVLVTDDWYDIGNPDSTGTAGDYQDFPITVGGG